MKNDYISKKGFITFAQNTKDVDYLRLAYALALSIKISQKSVSNISVITNYESNISEAYKEIFDEIIILDTDLDIDSNWKLKNESQLYDYLPYEEVIKLDCDMLLPKDISNYWNIFGEKSISSVHNPKNYRGETVFSSPYRKTSYENNIPTMYSAMSYFKKNDDSKEFFNLIKSMADDWEYFEQKYFKPESRENIFTTDIAYSLASKILGMHTQPYSRQQPSFVHMKTHIQNWPKHFDKEDWSEYVNFFLTPDCQIQIGNYLQTYPVHYHLKTLITDEHLSFLSNKYEQMKISE